MEMCRLELRECIHKYIYIFFFPVFVIIILKNLRVSKISLLLFTFKIIIFRCINESYGYIIYVLKTIDLLNKKFYLYFIRIIKVYIFTAKTAADAI